MNIVLLNPPNKHRIQRRFMCSYNAPNQLLPPQELMALGGVLRKLDNCKTFLIDAIAEQYNTLSVIEKLKSLQPDVIVAIQGFECFEEDINALEKIKQSLPSSRMVLFGHYATLFPEEILKNTNFDIVIIGEPDNIFYNLVTCLLNNDDLSQVPGIAYRNRTGIVVQSGDARIPHPELLPMPAYELLNSKKYFEPFLKAPFGLIQTARGCPYNCNYCVRSFGKRLTYRSTEQIIEEIVFLKENFGIRSLRFIDDTFTVHSKRVIELCKQMIELKLQLEWTCLSRIDTLDSEVIHWMKKAGCKRVYFGIESGSMKVLKYFDKEMDLTIALKVLQQCQLEGIEILGLFIVGAPVEEEEDFAASVDFAVKANFDYVIVSELIVYPGTPLFEQLQTQINFSLFPYKNEWKDGMFSERNKRREKEFYRRFYYRKNYFALHAGKLLRHPVQYLDNFTKLASFIFTKPENERADFI